MPKKKSVQKKDDDSKLFAFLATFLSVVGFIIALATKKDNKYVMFYAKQSLVIFIIYVIAAVVVIVPIIGWLLSPIIYVLGVILWIISWIYSLSGKTKKVPVVGKYAESINL
jgi:uncharacterized membrane protein